MTNDDRVRMIEVGEIVEKSFPDLFEPDPEGDPDRAQCIDFGGLTSDFIDFLNFAFKDRFIIGHEQDFSDWNGRMMWASVTDFVLKNSESYFCSVILDMVDDNAGICGVINVLIAGESFDSIESKFQDKMAEYSTIRGVHNE